VKTDLEQPAPLSHLEHAIEHAAHLLPAQGPITVFVHHNTLHAFEDLPFHEAVKKASRIFDCEPYLSEDRYRQELAKGRIRDEDLVGVLRQLMGPAADERVLSLGTRLELRMAMLKYPIRQAPDAELRWFVAETDALTRYRGDVPAATRERFLQETRHWVMRDLHGGHPPKDRPERQDRRDQDALADLFRRFGASTIECWSERTWEEFSLQALWRVCRDGVHGVKSAPTPARMPARHRDLLLEATGEDVDRLVDEVLIRFCAAFLDQGFSPWRLPNRQSGFYAAFLSLYRQGGGPPDRWLRGLSAELARLEDSRVGPLESVLESLEMLGVPEEEWEDFITSTLLALRGWAGMIRQMEVRGDRVAHPAPPGSLVGYLAVRLLLERLALSHTAREAMGFDGPLHRLRHALGERLPRHPAAGIDQQAFLVFQLAQALGLTPGLLHHLSKQEWNALVAEMEAFPPVERRHVMHLAFERRYYTETLRALASHAARPAARVADPRFQVVCCIDEREESLLRHVEEVAPDAEMFSVAGFFSVAMYYRGAADAHFIPQCPIVVRPQHWVVEDVAYTMADAHRRRARVRRALGTASQYIHVGSRTFAGGALTAVLGVIASVPLVARVLFPRLAAGVRRTFGRLVSTPPVTYLRLERAATPPTDPPVRDERQFGYTVEEMAGIAERVFRDLGLTSGFAPVVVFLGHGSNSLNNPHNSAYNCGACAGTAGAPNARAIAQIANDPRVRAVLTSRGLVIPPETVVVGGYHNTCNDSVVYFDLDRLPASHQNAFEQVRASLESACERNAHERSRRFQSAPLDMTFPAARRHVEERSEDLSQTRPECGHATNALCIVGRRSRTRGLFLDRRAFLNSYDPTQDDADHSILTRTLQAAVPVCAGISLEYYFSYTDSAGWGCGTKLPHNVAALLGVMNGAASDLRTGLPWQMVEIHEPVRLMFIIETTPEAMLQIMERNPGIDRLVRNGWCHLATLDPNSSRLHRFRDGRFEVFDAEPVDLPKVVSWPDWYRGWRDHLGFAQLVPNERTEPEAQARL
jgi:uncharacterized protein YbcC (UPF0753/DUF2309 family)